MPGFSLSANSLTFLVIRRVINGLAAVLLASLIAFLILESSPGDVITNLLGDEATAAQRQALEEELGLNKPVLQRYLDFLVNLAHGDLGVSVVSGRPVMTLIGQRFLNTLLLTCLAILLSVCVGLTMGVLSASCSNSRFDLAVLILTAVGLAAPSFGVAILLVQVFSVRLGWLPAVGGGTFRHFILPCLALAVPSTAVVARMVRSSLLEAARKPYVVAAHAKGLSSRRVWQKHVFRNALIPVLTLMGVQFGHLLSGAFVVETIFAWPGLGRLTVQAIFDQDYPVVLGAVILSALVFQILNAVVDLISQQLDPRLQVRG